MLTRQSLAMMRALNSQNPMSQGFQRIRNLAFSTGYFAFVGNIITCLALWSWFWHNTHFQDYIVFKLTGGVFEAISFYLYTHIRRGGGAFFILSALIGFAAIFMPASCGSIFTRNPFGATSILISIGLFIYAICSRSMTGILFNTILTIILICIFWFNPQFAAVWILTSTGIAIMLTACISRYFIFLNSYY